jgi:hypothetical protein
MPETKFDTYTEPQAKLYYMFSDGDEKTGCSGLNGLCHDFALHSGNKTAIYT